MTYPTFRRFAALFLLLLVTGVCTAEQYRWSGVERIVVFGDSHGAYPALVGMLQKANVIDTELAWAGGATHLVGLGDYVDRGPESRKILDLLMRLEKEAPAVGGMVHVLLGNHEIMNMTGDLRYVAAEEYAAFAKDDIQLIAGFPTGFLAHRVAFSLFGHYGSWLAKKPLMIVINDAAFVHGGLSEGLAKLKLEQINEQAGQDLRDFMVAQRDLFDAGVFTYEDDFRVMQEKALVLASADNEELGEVLRGEPDETIGEELDEPITEDEGEAIRDAAAVLNRTIQGLPFSPHGPVWYRRTAMCHPFNEYPVTSDILKHLEAERVFIGHTVTNSHRVGRRLDGLVYQVDTGMLTSHYEGVPAMTVIEGGEVQVYYADHDGPSTPIQVANREWERPYGMTDAEIEDFLLNATVVLDEELPTGITKPHRLTLEQNGRRMRAVFKTEDSHPGLEKGRWERSGENSDRYVYDVAAYKLDRHMGLDMTPVAVLRTHDGDRGVVQYWVENSILESERREQDVPYTGYCDPNAQWKLQDAIDILIHNVDRNQTNILWDRDNWYLWLIDNSRAFRTSRRAPRIYSSTKVIPNEWFATSLEKLTVENMHYLSDYLNRSQINAIELRAEKILKNR